MPRKGSAWVISPESSRSISHCDLLQTYTDNAQLVKKAIEDATMLSTSTLCLKQPTNPQHR